MFCALITLLQYFKNIKQEHWMKNRICTKFALCKLCANINLAKVCTHCVSGGLPSLHTLCKLGNHHLRNGCKPKQCRCLLQVCTRQTLCKFDFSSSGGLFCPPSHFTGGKTTPCFIFLEVV